MGASSDGLEQLLPQPPAMPGLSAPSSRPARSRPSVAKPAKSPMKSAATVLARVKGRPTTTVISTNISGSMIGEAMAKAMTAESGTPAASSAAISGTTPQEQKGDKAPKAAASTMVRTGERDTAPAISRSAPAALSQAASSTEISRKGRIQPKARSVKTTLSAACSGRKTARAANSRTSAVQTR